MQEVKIGAGETKDIALYVNASGKIHLAIRTEDGQNDLPSVWWITWGFGSVKQVGPLRNSATLDIPVGVFRGVVVAKLRGSARVNTVVRYSERVSPDAGFSFQWG